MFVRPQVGLAARALLQRAGVSVDLMASPVRCGWMAFTASNSGRARREMLAWLEAAEGQGTIVIPSPAVAQFIRAYATLLFEEEPDLLARVQAVAKRTWELFTFLAARNMPPLAPALPGKGVLIPTCPTPVFPHLTEDISALLTDDARDRLPFIPSPHCCSWGGAFHLDMPELSAAMHDTLLDAAAPLAPDYLAVLDVGCQIYLEEALDRRGSNLPVYHLAQVLTGEVS